MANHIDTTYFVSGQTAIPNVASTATAGAAIAVTVTRYITMYEPDFIKKLLGDDLYADYVATPTDAKWNAFKALLYNATTKISPIANYVWYIYQEQNQVMMTGGGDKKSGDATMTPEVNVAKMIGVWDSMRKMVADIVDYFDANTATFPLWDGGASAEFYFDMVNNFDI
jgi:hypothetical protein